MAKTINEIGTTYVGVGRPESDGWRPATLWIVFLAIPLVPLRRVILRPVGVTSDPMGASTQLEILSSGWIRPLEVLSTFVVCWALILPAALGPLIYVCVNLLALNETWFVGALIWLFVVYFFVKNRLNGKLLAKPWC